MHEKSTSDPAQENPLGDYNQMIIDQINERVFNGFAPSQYDDRFCVIRSESTGVLSVIAQRMVAEGTAVAFGPDVFRQCVRFVNSSMVTSTAVAKPLLRMHSTSE